MEDIRQVNVRGTLYNVTSTANVNMAPIEDGDTASQAYAINKLMVFKGYLCKTTTSIAQGDTLAVGTNLTYDTIAEEIEGLSDGIGGTTDTFRFGTDGNGEYGYIKKVGGADTFFPFKTKHTETVTPTSRAQVDMGEYHKKRYVTLTSVPNNNTTTYSATTRGASLDMGATNTHRYVNTNGVPNSNSGTYSVTANGTHDMGETNSYRYVNVAVANANPVANRKTTFFNNATTGSISGLTVGQKYLFVVTQFKWGGNSYPITINSGATIIEALTENWNAIIAPYAAYMWLATIKATSTSVSVTIDSTAQNVNLLCIPLL